MQAGSGEERGMQGVLNLFIGAVFSRLSTHSGRHAA